MPWWPRPFKSKAYVHVGVSTTQNFTSTQPRLHAHLQPPDGCRPDTCTWPPCTLVIALMPLKCSSRNLQFPQHREPFTKKKMPWCPCPFKERGILACRCTAVNIQPTLHILEGTRCLGSVELVLEKRLNPFVIKCIYWLEICLKSRI